ncbi:MAG: 2-oxo acid dehydrogenase subunit E2 [Bacteroidetes bacterium]|nr:2-oxo acid dehydrogenase subunit E2 [Bacteroidota bacterium]
MPIYQLVLPAMGESVSEATVTQWLKKEGDAVVADEAVVEVATDKVDSEVASEYNGVIKEILHPVNAVVAVDAALALIETDEVIPQQTVVESTPVIETPVAAEATETAESYMEQAQELVTPATQASSADSRFYSPLVKNIAKQENISEAELATISGTGKDGRVTKRDILAYVQNRKAPQTPPPTAVKTPIAPPPISRGVEDAIVPMTRMEQMISEHMTRSLQTSAHVQSFIEIDVTKLWKWREKVKQDFVKQHGVKLTFTPIFFQLVAQILPEFPLLNSSLDGTDVIKKKDINLGMATALPDGNLIVPVIKQADSLNLVGLAKRVHELASNARNNALNPDDVQGGTYTITNVGMFGSLTGTPIINQPQVAILALGAIRKVPAVLETEHGDVIAVRHQMVVSHSYDHRIINGAMGGMFLLRLKERIENWDNTQTI